MVDLKNPRTRRYIYRVIVVLMPIAVVLGLITNEMAPLIISAFTAVLGLSLADVNVPVNEDQ